MRAYYAFWLPVAAQGWFSHTHRHTHRHPNHHTHPADQHISTHVHTTLVRYRNQRSILLRGNLPQRLWHHLRHLYPIADTLIYFSDFNLTEFMTGILNIRFNDK